jgi:hypothetical protein
MMHGLGGGNSNGRVRAPKVPTIAAPSVSKGESLELYRNSRHFPSYMLLIRVLQLIGAEPLLLPGLLQGSLGFRLRTEA